jgi:hypothetical protein
LGNTSPFIHARPPRVFVPASLRQQKPANKDTQQSETLTKPAGGIHTTPAMAADVSDHVWKLEELIALLGVSQK